MLVLMRFVILVLMLVRLVVLVLMLVVCMVLVLVLVGLTCLVIVLVGLMCPVIVHSCATIQRITSLLDRPVGISLNVASSDGGIRHADHDQCMYHCWKTEEKH